VARAPDQAATWLTLSTVYRIVGRKDDSLQAAERAATLMPNSVQVLVNYGRSLEEVGQFENSLTMYTRALEMNPEKDLSYRVGRLLVRLGRGEEAEQHLLAANKDSPHDEALFLLAKYYDEQGRFEEAMLGYEALLKIESAHTAEVRERLTLLKARPGER
jgi:tetratricopeptide (TPR) repeat protein